MYLLDVHYARWLHFVKKMPAKIKKRIALKSKKTVGKKKSIFLEIES
jgi:hypothetical protein